MMASLSALKDMRGSLSTLAVPLGALLVAMALFALFLLLAGASPLGVFGDMAIGAFGSRFSIENALSRGSPLMLTALCTALPARSALT